MKRLTQSHVKLMLHPHLSIYRKANYTVPITKNTSTTKSWKRSRNGYKHTHRNEKGTLIHIDVGYNLPSTNAQEDIGKEHQ